MRKTIIISIILFSTMLMGIGSCKKVEPCDQGVKGVFKDFTGLDGCGWVIELENDKVIEPSNIESFMIVPEEDKEVWVSYESAALASICMVGEVVVINCISSR